MARYKLAAPLEAFRVGDTPGVVRVELATPGGQLLSLEDVTGADAELVSPAGVVVAIPAAVDGDELELTVGELVEAGVYELELTVTTASSSVGVEPAPFIVEARRDGWHTLASAREQWADAPKRDVTLHTFLAGAREQVTDYGPELAAGARVPLSWQQAQLMQARNCWNAAKTDPASGGIGGDDLVFRPYPMDQTIRLLIRPKRAIGAIA